jgi:hypothetical protein
VGVFIFLQRKNILDLARPSSAEAVPIPVAATS